MTIRSAIDLLERDERLDAEDRAALARKRTAAQDFLAQFDAEPAPCDGCPYRKRCKNEQLACLEYALFVHPEFLNSPRLKFMASRVPHDAPYAWIFRSIFNFEETHANDSDQSSAA